MFRNILFKVGSFIPLAIFVITAHLGQESAWIGFNTALILMVFYFLLAKRHSKVSYFDIGFLLLFLTGFILASLDLFNLFIIYTPANIYLTLTLVAFLPLLLRKDPFTYHFAKGREPEMVWQTPQFRTINLIITIVWGIIFLVSLLISIIRPVNDLFVTFLPVILQLGLGLPFTLKFPGIYLRRNLPKEALSIYESLKDRKKGGEMKILGIVGSPHRRMGNTYKLVSLVMEEAERLGAETETVVLSDLKIGYCQGCGKCLSEGRCPQDDDMEGLVEKIFAADGIILASPTYIFSVTAQMKTFLDRCVWLGHRPQLHGRYGLAISVSAGYGEEDTVNYLSDFLSVLGVNVVGRIHGLAVLPGEFVDKELLFSQARQIGSELIAAIKEKRRYPTTGRAVIFHKFMRDLIFSHREFFRADYNYWHDLGWFKQGFNLEERPMDPSAKDSDIKIYPRTVKEAIEGMPGVFNKEAARNLRAVVQFRVSGEGGGDWYLSIENGECRCFEGVCQSPTLTIYTPADVWLGISQGELSGQQAYMKGQYKIKGDLGLLMRFDELFSGR